MQMVRSSLIAAVAGVLLGTTGLTILGAVIGAVGGVAGLCAFVQMLRIKSSLTEIENMVRSAVDRTEEAQPPPENG